MKWWQQGGDDGELHYLGCLDKSAGARMYGAGGGATGKRKRKKFWMGWNGQASIDQLTGAALDITYLPNEEQEHHAYPRVLERVKDKLGCAPQAVTVDAGYATKAVHLLNVNQGIHTVAPWRKTSKSSRRVELQDEEVDRHGVPRCRACSAPGKTHGSGLGFVMSEYGTPMIRFRCMAKLTDDCRGVQKIPCRHEPRLLGPLRHDTLT